jgi:xanthine/CO dehydrogenase XdhC/CoxF family maturation factor
MAEGSMTDDVLEIAQNWSEAGHAVALATVTETWGSSPRPVGSQLVVRDDGAFRGSVSGGCIEGAVIAEAQAAMSDGEVRSLEFSISNEQAWEVGLTCGGTVRVFVAALA